jgi:Papain-like cysteine protease AvrRpt2
LKMVMDCLNDTKLVEKIDNLSVDDIARIVKTDILGTEIEDVRALNSHSAITKASPSIEFDATVKPHELEDIEHDLKEELPPIAWITNGKAPYEWKHAVVITKLDRANGVIHYNDPAIGATKEENLKEFSQKWYDSDRCMVRVILGRRDTRRITEYTERGSDT